MKKIKAIMSLVLLTLVISGCSDVFASRSGSRGSDSSESSYGRLRDPVTMQPNSQASSGDQSPETQEADPAPTQEPVPTPVTLPAYSGNGDLELPVEGATGILIVPYDVKDSTGPEAGVVFSAPSGTVFRIISETGDWWEVQGSDFHGWVQHFYCMINLPDVIPSAVYNNTNTYSSLFISSGRNIPNITGLQLYFGKSYNNRLQKEEYIVPVLYSMSKKIAKAQKNALAAGDTLVIYEGYRPMTVQQRVVDELTALSNVDAEVMAGINSWPWSTDWFIATTVANHQQGYAMDVSLAHVTRLDTKATSRYSYSVTGEWEEYTMPTQIHELSSAAATFSQPVTSMSETDWINAPLSPTMNSTAVNLQKYCTDAGMTPLASEWWHFNDLASKKAMDNVQMAPQGDFLLQEIMSIDDGM